MFWSKLSGGLIRFAKLVAIAESGIAKFGAAVDADLYVFAGDRGELRNGVENPLLDRVFEQIVSSRVGSDVFRQGEHRGVFAGAVVVELGGIFVRPQHSLRLGFVEGQMSAAPQIGLSESGTLQHFRRQLNMNRFARMRSARHRDLFFGMAEPVRRPARDEWDRLERFRGRPEKCDGLRIAER